jgi:hypothetical protein
MISPEVLPVIGGFILGSIARYTYNRTQRWTHVIGIVIIALCATIASGEFRQSWGFLFDDIIIVSLAASSAFLLVGHIARRKPGRD